MADLQKIDAPGSLERPDWIKSGTEGTEHIKKDDLRLPRLAIAQGLSPQINDPNSPKYMPDLKLGEMFNDLTGEIIGKGPIYFMIVRADPARYVEFNPREAGGGVKDLNVPENDARTRFSVDPVTGQSLKPVATKFYDYVILRYPFNAQDPMSNIIALSFKSSGLKVARELNSLVKLRGTDIYTGVYSLSAGTEKNAKGTYGQYIVKNAGWPKSKEESELAKQIHDSLKDKTIIIDREPGDDTEFEETAHAEDSHQM